MAYERTVAAPTTGSLILLSMTPTCCRTTPYASESRCWKKRSDKNSGRKQTQTTIVSCQL